MAGELTWIDFGIAEFLQQMSLMIPDVYFNYPTLVAYQERLWKLPELQSYLKSDRFDEFCCVPPMVQWKPQTHVTLGYWKIRGLAERIRHLLEYLKVPYNQVVYSGP